MTSSRREFIKAGVAGATVAATGLPAVSAAGEHTKKNEPLDILILGGCLLYTSDAADDN